MKLSDLDERSIEILNSLIEEIGKNSKFYTHSVGNIQSQVKGVRFSEAMDLFQILSDNTDIGFLDKSIFKISQAKFNHFQKEGGIRAYIEREKAALSEQEDHQTALTKKLELQIKQLERITDEKFIEARKDLDAKQKAFHVSTTKKNNRWMWTSIVAIILSVIAIIVSLLVYFYPN